MGATKVLSKKSSLAGAVFSFEKKHNDLNPDNSDINVFKNVAVSN